MNDFTLASGRSVTLSLGELLVDVKQATMADFDYFITDALPIKKDLLALENKDIAEITKTFLSHAAQTVALLTRFTSLDNASIEQMASQLEHISQVIYAFYSLNSAFFDEPEPKQTKAKADNRNTWFDGFQFLISQGHKHSEIMQYSYGAYLGYCKAAGRAYKNDLKAQANMYRTAQHGDKSAMDKFNRELSKD